jgi:hypothetical protein
LARKKRKVQLPRAAVEQLMSAAQMASERGKKKTAQDIFKGYLRLMDKYSDYFFSEPWLKKWDIKRATTFSREDLDFINENDDEFVDRAVTVFMKKNISLEGFNASWGMFWTEQAYYEQFVKPDLKQVYEAFKELVNTGAGAEEILTKLLENDDVGFVHSSLVELLKDENYLWDNKPLDLKVSEALEFIHTKEGYPECEEDECKRQRGKLKKKP